MTPTNAQREQFVRDVLAALYEPDMPWEGSDRSIVNPPGITLRFSFRLPSFPPLTAVMVDPEPNELQWRISFEGNEVTVLYARHLPALANSIRGIVPPTYLRRAKVLHDERR